MPDFPIPADDLKDAIAVRFDNNKYCLYKTDPLGGYLFISHKRHSIRRVDWVKTESEAQAKLEKLFPWK